MPVDFFFPDTTRKLWVPLTRATGFFGQAHGLARLRQGVSLAQAQLELDTLQRGTQQAASGSAPQPGIFPIYRIVVGKYGAAMWTLLAAVMLLLLIGCANVSNLLLARGVGREKEFAVRASLGAGRARIFRMLLAENVLMALVAGVAGILAAWWGLVLLRELRLADIPRFNQARIDASVLLFGLGVALVSGVMAGLAPAWKAAGADLLSSLQVGGAGTHSGAHGRLRDLIVTVEVAIALVLLVGAGLLINSFVRIVRADWGFNPDHLLLVDVRLPSPASRSVDENTEYMRELIARLSRIPGVTSASMALGVPIDYGYGGTTLAVNGNMLRPTGIPKYGLPARTISAPWGPQSCAAASSSGVMTCLPLGSW
jgi:putative ABC transport system permease protein